jgi:anti-sigma factor RsiW
MNVNRLFGNGWKHRKSLSLFALDRLPREKSEPLQAHLERCPECRAELARLREVSQGFAQWSAVTPGIVPSAKAQFRLRQSIKAQRPRPELQSAGLAAWLRRHRFGLAGFGAAWGLILFLNVDAPATIQMAERSQPGPPKLILAALMSKNLNLIIQLQHWQTQPPPPPHSRRSRVNEISYC